MSSRLDRPAGNVWDLVERSSTLIEVAWPLARIVPVDGKFPERWIEGTTSQCRSFLFGFFPVGTRRIFFERIDGSSMQLQSRESDPLVKRWDHLISVKPLDESSCVYTDEIEIDAGVITSIVWLWANWFYRHRQARWQKMLKKNP
ncbi:MAG: hypothetical protein AB7O96_03545 [Pseudobdellovibrionaceae bacterium]